MMFHTEMGTKKVLCKESRSDSRGPVDIAISLVNSALYCVTGK